MEFLIYVAITVGLLMLGFLAGTLAESTHFASLTRRESAVADIIQTQLKSYLSPSRPGQPPKMLVAETVIGSDHFKRFLGAFRKFFGGEMRSYNSLVERARRETTLRLLEQARREGFNAICNLRLEPAVVGGANQTMLRARLQAGKAIQPQFVEVQATAPRLLLADVTVSSLGAHGRENCNSETRIKSSLILLVMSPHVTDGINGCHDPQP